MQLIVNGEEKTVAAATVRELVHHLGLADQPVAVEINRQLIPRRSHEATALNDGDVVELVTLVGGG